MAPKLLNSSNKRTRPRAPGVKAGLDLMASLGGIAVLGTQAQPYYYFPPDKRAQAGIDRCQRCVTQCGPKAACNVQPYIRVGTNLWKGRQCYYCTIFPAELEGDRCSLDGALYVYDGDNSRLLPVNANGEVVASVLESAIPDALTPPPSPPVKTVEVELPERKTTPPPHAHGLPTPAATPVRDAAAPVQPVVQPIMRLTPEWTNKPVAPPVVSLPTPVTAPRTAAPSRVPAPAPAPIVPLAPVHEPIVHGHTHQHTHRPPAFISIPTPASVTPSAVSTPRLPLAPVAQADPLAQLASARRPMSTLTSLGAMLASELQELKDVSAEVERLCALLRAKEEEQAAKVARVERHRSAVDEALAAIEEERLSLLRMRESLLFALQ